MDIGNNCVHCNKDTSFGTGKFVNRIPADADYEAEDEEGNIIFDADEYREGYACEECYSEEVFVPMKHPRMNQIQALWAKHVYFAEREG